jgi:hypothetical protein
MTNEEIITAKSAEIKRLHNVCQQKDKALNTIILRLIALSSRLPILLKPVLLNIIDDAKEIMG